MHHAQGAINPGVVRGVSSRADDRGDDGAEYWTDWKNVSEGADA